MTHAIARMITPIAILLSASGFVAGGAGAQTASSSAYENGVLVDPGAKTFCLAIGHSFTARAAQLGEKMKTFDQTFPDPDAGQKKIKDNLTSLQEQLRSLGSALEDMYDDANAPAQAEQASVDAMSLRDLLSASQKCTQ